MQVLKEIGLSYANIKLLERKLVRLEIFANREIGLSEAREMNEAIGMLSGGKESLVLIMADELTQFSKAALDFSSSPEGLRYTIGDALVVKSMAQRLTANFYLKVNKPIKPSRIFNSEKEAIKWLYKLEEVIIPA